mgnify:CR=1 FL=1
MVTQVGKQKSRLNFDPRTKLVMLFAYSIIIMIDIANGPALIIRTVMTMIPVLLLFIEGKRAAAVRFVLLYIAASYLMRIHSQTVGGLPGMLILAYATIVMQFFPTIITVWYCIRTTGIDEFMAAMNRMHMPQGMAISIAVMMRFFPTIVEEYKSIRDAMRMRGVQLGGGKPGKIIEYRMIPLLFSCLSIGEDLSAAAITRGLGAPVRRTNVSQIGFHVRDLVFMLLLIALTVSYIYLARQGGAIIL